MNPYKSRDQCHNAGTTKTAIPVITETYFDISDWLATLEDRYI